MRLFLVLLSLIAASKGAVWSPPAANQGNWIPGTNIGVPGGIEQYAAGGVNDRAVTGTVINITDAPYSADNTGMADCRDALADAVDDASPGDVIYFPAGTYFFDTGFIFTAYKDNITLRGPAPGEGTATLYLSFTASPLIAFSNPSGLTENTQTVTGTKTKGTSTLAIANTTGYTVGCHIGVLYENEVDEARITAGAAPVWHSLGSPFKRSFTAVVTAVSANTSITIDPPLVADATNLTLQTKTYAFNNTTTGWGFEDLTISFDSASHPTSFCDVNAAEYCWWYRLKFPDWSKQTSSGSCIKLSEAYRCQVQKCDVVCETGASSDGVLVETSQASSCLFADNGGSGPMDQMFYESGNSVNNVYAYNFVESGALSYFHNAHPSLNVIEGNRADYHQSDGYHGSSSHNTLFRNWWEGQIAVVLNRFKRYYCLTGNIFGTDGTYAGRVSYGNPNIGNGWANGFAGPTGLSDQEGQTDYKQPGFDFDEYVIQAGDISEGDFWSDFEITGELITRTSDTEGVFTVSHGTWFSGSIPGEGAPGGTLLIYCWSSNKTVLSYNGTVTDVDGSDVTIEFAGGTLPATSTVCQLYMGPSGWQERDLDVQATTTLAHNYTAAAMGSGSVTNSISPDTLPDSLVYDEKPSWFYGLAWPPYNPNDYATATANRIPAEYRFNNDGEDPPAEGGGGSTTISGSGSTTISGSGSTTIQ